MRSSFLLIFVFLCSALWSKETIYLSPSGRDTNNGTKQSPLYSLTAARDLIRNKTGNDTIYVSINGGTYFMNEPLVLTNEDSHPIVFEGEGNSKPQFIGGIKINGWKKVEGNIWKAHVPETTHYGFTFEQFYINDRRATRARTPNKGWYNVLSGTETSYDKGVRYAKYATQQISVSPSEIKNLNNLTAKEQRDISVMFYHKWDITRKYIDYVIPDSGKIFINGEGMRAWNPIGKGDRFILENYKSALDSPGEWFLSREGDVYYMPLEGEDMTNAECFAPANSQFIILRGEMDKPLNSKVFKNIAFKVSSYRMPQNGNNPMQAAADVDAAIMADFASDITFYDCEVSHTGGYAVWLRRECHNNTVEHCNLYDLGAGGVKIGDQMNEDGRKVTSHNIVNNNIIQHAGYVFPTAVGVVVINASDNKIIHNEISDLRYSGISLGWVWGYTSSGQWTNIVDKGTLDFKFGHFVSPAVRNIVENNHIHHIGWGELSDMGAIYTLGESPGTRVCNNVIHDVYSYDYGGWGLYTDEGSSEIVMENNLVYGCKSGSFHQHYGKENIIRNNIFAFGQYCGVQYTRVEPHKSFTFTNNIILMDCGVAISGPWKEGNIDMNHNCYWDLRGKEIKFGNLSFSEWRKYKDFNSVIADPLFVDPLKGDFRFKNLKTAKQIGFKPFEFTKAGVYGSQEWIDKAKLSPVLVNQFRDIIFQREKEHSRIYDK